MKHKKTDSIISKNKAIFVEERSKPKTSPIVKLRRRYK